MDYSIKYANPETLRTDCLIIGIFTSKKLSIAAQAVNDISDGSIQNILKHGDIQGDVGQTQLLHNVPNLPAKRLLLVGLGQYNKPGKLTTKDYYKVHTAAAEILSTLNIRNAVSCLADLDSALLENQQQEDWLIRQAIIATDQCFYQFQNYKSDKKAPHKLEKLQFSFQKRGTATKVNRRHQGLKQGMSIATGINTSKNLGNAPGNICTPTYLASEAKKLENQYRSLKIEILEEADMKKLGMGSFLSVSQGSKQAGKLIVMQYMKGKRGKKPAVLVGKGITFDTGGISLKPGTGMDEMKYDMCGAASVLGTMQACAQMQLAVNLVGIIACAENMPGGQASKPGDIVTSMSGQTIEILNTDAEGRLVLCDALTYVEKFNPAVVIDIATLTGACIMALGRTPSGLLSNHQPLADALTISGQIANDRVWQLPLWDDYQELLNSNFADMANIGGRDAGTITAGCFLSRFTKKYQWAHIDVAGTAWKTGNAKGATGRPVPLLVQYLLDKHADKSV